MTRNEKERILIVDDNPARRETLTRWLRAEGYDVDAADTGEEAFVILRDRSRPIDWLYTRASLPGLVDGWILADEYHDTHRSKAVILSTPGDRLSPFDDVIVRQKNPSRVFKALHLVMDSSLPPRAAPEGYSASRRHPA